MHRLSRAVGRMVGMRPRRWLPRPTPPRRPSPPRVAVVGGGIAGVSAAVVLAERGVPVVLVEAADRLGGRLSAEPYHLDDGTTQLVDHGFHGFFRQYYNWRRVLDRVDVRLRPLGSYPVTSLAWPDEQLDELPPAPPASILALVLTSPSLRVGELARVDHEVGRELLAYDARDTYERLDRMSAHQLLTDLGLGRRARSMLFDVFAHSFFDDAASMSAAEMVAMFHFYFLANPEGLGMDAPGSDYQTAVWGPLGAYLEGMGVDVATSTSVTALEPSTDGWRVRTDSGEIVAGEVVLATDALAASRLLDTSPRARRGDRRLERVAACPLTGPPYAVARFWLDGDVQAHRAPFTSIAEPGHLDSVTLYHRVEEGARRWSERTGGAVVELHAYACPRGVPATELGASMRTELTALWPEIRTLRVVGERCRVGHDAAGFPVGAYGDRPGVTTAVDGLLLAGDWVATPFPSALMERAAATGVLAANEILAGCGRRPETVWSVPPRGLLAGAR